MTNDEIRIWGIHTQDDYLFLKNNVITIGWSAMGDLSCINANRDAFKEKYTQVYPDTKKEILQPVQECFIDSAMKCRLAIMLYSPQRVTGK